MGLEQSAGVLVATVAVGGPGDTAGLRAGDVILAINEAKTESVDAIHRLIDGDSIGTRARLSVFREGRLTALTIIIAERPG
jgi:serine protease Do